MNSEKFTITYSPSEPILGFLKFSKNIDWLKTLQDGILYMNPAQFYIDLEKKTNKKGMADKDECSIPLNNFSFKLKAHKTGEIVMTGTSQKANITLNDANKRPIFCMTALDEENLKIVNETSEEYILAIELANLDKIKTEFGEHVLFINPEKMIDQLISKLESDNLSCRAQKVIYSNLDINTQTRINDCISIPHQSIFYKNQELAYQNEYRIALTSIDTNTAYQLNIGSLKDCSYLTTIDQLANLILYAKKTGN